MSEIYYSLRGRREGVGKADFTIRKIFARLRRHLLTHKCPEMSKVWACMFISENIYMTTLASVSEKVIESNSV